MHLWVLELACPRVGTLFRPIYRVSWKTASFEWRPEQRRALLKIHIGEWVPLPLDGTSGLQLGSLWYTGTQCGTSGSRRRVAPF